MPSFMSVTLTTWFSNFLSVKLSMKNKNFMTQTETDMFKNDLLKIYCLTLGLFSTRVKLNISFS